MMLAKFSVKNYRGFSERIEWDLATPPTIITFILFFHLS